MAYVGSAVAITSTGIVTVATSTGNGPASVLIQFYTTGPAYLGGSGVTSSGFAFSTAYQPITLPLMPGETLYGASTANVTLNVLKHYDW